MLVYVMLMLDELVAHRLFQVGALAADARYFIDNILHQMKAIDVVLNAHVKRRGDRALLLVSPDVEVPICSAIGQPMDERRIAVKLNMIGRSLVKSES
jgi:hypothetical protein